MKNSQSIYFNKDQYKKVLQSSRIILKGRRGLSSKKKRIKIKIFRETLSKVIGEIYNDIIGKE